MFRYEQTYEDRDNKVVFGIQVQYSSCHKARQWVRSQASVSQRALFSDPLQIMCLTLEQELPETQCMWDSGKQLMWLL